MSLSQSRAPPHARVLCIVAVAWKQIKKHDGCFRRLDRLVSIGLSGRGFLANEVGFVFALFLVRLGGVESVGAIKILRRITSVSVLMPCCSRAACKNSRLHGIVVSCASMCRGTDVDLVSLIV